MISKEFIQNEPNLLEMFLDEYKIEGGEVVLFGCSADAFWYIRWLARQDIFPTYIIDNDPDKQGTFFEEKIEGKNVKIPIISKEDMKRIANFQEFTYVVGAPRYKHEILRDIEQTFGKVKAYSFECIIYYQFIKDIPAYRKYLVSHLKELGILYDLLEDQKSRDTLDNFLKGRITANQDYFMDVAEDQYFPKDIIRLNENETIVEVGSHDGKTLSEIVDKTAGQFNKIYCFEPDKECIHWLENIISEFGKPITLIPKGCGAESAKVFFKSDAALGCSKVVEEGMAYDYSIDITTLDKEIKEDVTYIKMDIEGLELDCLKGAEQLIRRCTPKLAVCVYHNPEDILEIPLYLHTINCNYKFYLRHHNVGINATETVLYAVTE